MNVKPFQQTPVWLAFGVLALVSLLRLLRLDFVERLELTTYDLRVRAALASPHVTSTNLGFLDINDESVRRVWDGSLGYHFGLYWPRQVYGRVVEELAAQGAQAVAFDVLFGELRPDHPLVKMADGSFQESDDFFARQMSRAGNVIIATTPEIMPPPLFLTNALAPGDIQAEKDSDGVLRRARAFRIYRRWHAAFRQLEADPAYGVDLSEARVEARRIVLPRRELGDISIPLNAEGEFDLGDFGGERLPAGAARRAKPFTEERVWHMGVVLAARELGLDLSKAEVDFSAGRVVLRNDKGLERTIPVDQEGYFYIDWGLPQNHPSLTEQAIQELLAQALQRLEGHTNHLENRWRTKLVVIGSSVVGNNLTDRGATPLSADTVLVSKHWNVANSIIAGVFVRRLSLAWDLLLIIVLGAAAAVLTWKLRVLAASGVVALVWGGYGLLAFLLYTRTRLWIPMFLPMAGALVTHGSLVTWRVLFEQTEQRRLRSIFSTIVSPKIVHELLRTGKLALGGARREVSVFFADVRGFSDFIDASQEQVAEYVRGHQLTGQAAEACFDSQAAEALRTINLYLGCVAEKVIQQDGTLDKFIGDCVMAFWGAPTPNPQHALACVRAAIAAQRAVFHLNQLREQENRRREAENQLLVARGEPVLPLLPVLLFGTGINTGMATVGLMGSEAKTGLRQGNYTVFGREVNLASRLENASGHGRIFITQTTFDHLLRDDPDLAGSCIRLNPVQVKGFRAPVQVFEVPWNYEGSPPRNLAAPVPRSACPESGPPFAPGRAAPS